MTQLLAFRKPIVSAKILFLPKGSERQLFWAWNDLLIFLSLQQKQAIGLQKLFFIKHKVQLWKSASWVIAGVGCVPSKHISKLTRKIKEKYNINERKNKLPKKGTVERAIQQLTAGRRAIAFMTFFPCAVNHYKCPKCAMTCPNPSGLKHHMRYKHNDDRPFACQYCPYK